MLEVEPASHRGRTATRSGRKSNEAVAGETAFAGACNLCGL